MARTRSYSVWSFNDHPPSWLEVGEGMSKKEADEAAERKHSASEKLNVPGAFVVLPAGERPDQPPEYTDNALIADVDV